MEVVIPPEVAEQLGYYVYLYTDPRPGKDKRPFYVGKGKGNRALAHLSDKNESNKTKILKELREAGCELRIEILARSLPDSTTALRIEAAVIDLLGLDSLTNLVRGSDSIEFGRVPLPYSRESYEKSMKSKDGVPRKNWNFQLGAKSSMTTKDPDLKGA